MEVTVPVRGSFSKVGGEMLEVTVPESGIDSKSGWGILQIIQEGSAAEAAAHKFTSGL